MGKWRTDVLLFNTIAYSILFVICIACLIPFWLTLSGSFTAESSLFLDGYRLIPNNFSFEAYTLIFQHPDIVVRSYLISITLVVVGTIIGLFLTALTSYVLHRKDFKYRNKLAYFFFFTTLFSGGLVPWYIFMVNLGFNNNILALLLPNAITVFNIIIMRTFFNGIPESLGESAKIDGANDFLIFMKIYLPMSQPALATVGLFIALTYWNEWYLALLFISDSKLFPLQYLLYKIFNSIELSTSMAQNAGVPMANMPKESFKMAMTIIVTGPIVLMFAFVQKYFVKGIMIGAVKG